MPIHRLNAVPPLIQVGLSVGIAYRMRGTGGPPTGGTGLIDTGASQSAISPSLIERLNPQRLRLQDYNRPGGTLIPAWTYSMLLCFEPDLGDEDWVADAHWFPVIAIGAAPATPGVDVLIGQDLLANLALAWDGPRGRLNLMY
jgi:hypothetical protein